MAKFIKLTQGQATVFVNTSQIKCMYPSSPGTLVMFGFGETDYFIVKETIEEIMEMVDKND